MATQTKSVPVRLPESLYQAIQKFSRESGQSMNSLIVESLTERIRRVERDRLYESFTLLGSDEDPEVEHAFVAQSETASD